MPPDELGLERRETLEDALSHQADLNMPMIGRQLAADAAPIFFGLTVEELIALPTLARPHGHHPEVIGPRSDGVESVLEGEFDFEAQGVEADNLGGREREIGRQEKDWAAGRMEDGDQAHQATGGTPQQIT